MDSAMMGYRCMSLHGFNVAYHIVEANKMVDIGKTDIPQIYESQVCFAVQTRKKIVSF
jgi:hypothetical protein